jgi:hypothetical protein
VCEVTTRSNTHSHPTTDRIPSSSNGPLKDERAATQQSPLVVTESYADDGAYLRSPGLTAVEVQLTPSPSPPPVVKSDSKPLSSIQDTPSRFRRRKCATDSSTRTSDPHAGKVEKAFEDLWNRLRGPSISNTTPYDSGFRSVTSIHGGHEDTRVHLDPGSPLSLTHDQLRGRDAGIVYAENGVIEVVLGAARDRTNDVLIRDQTGLIRNIKTTSGIGGGIMIVDKTGDVGPSNVLASREHRGAGFPHDKNDLSISREDLQPTVEDYHFDTSNKLIPELRKNGSHDIRQANVSTKREPRQRDGPGVKKEEHHPLRHRATVTHERDRRRDSRVGVGECTDPNCTICGPNTLPTSRPEILSSGSTRNISRLSVVSDQRPMRSDPAAYYASPSSPTYSR